jgi:hypothetical protein
MPRKKDALVPSSRWIAICGLIETVLDRFGWPGALLIFFAAFVVHYGTTEQKTAIIDMYVLGKGVNVHYPLIVLGVVSVLVFFAQRYYFAKKMRQIKDELKRLGKWKTDHQEKEIGAPPSP